MKALVATFGFDIDFVMRQIASSKYKDVTLLALKTGQGYDRVEKAFHLLAVTCGSMQINCNLDPIDPSNLIRSIYSTLERIASRNDVEQVDLFLTGGPRALVVSSLISALLLPLDLGKKVNVVVEGEAFEYRLEVQASLLKSLINLDERNVSIVMALSQRPMNLNELSDSTGIPKTSVFRRVNDLIDLNILCKQDTQFTLCDKIKRIL